MIIKMINNLTMLKSNILKITNQIISSNRFLYIKLIYFINYHLLKHSKSHLESRDVEIVILILSPFLILIHEHIW